MKAEAFAFALIFFIFAGMATIAFHVSNESTKRAETLQKEMKTFKEHCIDAGGYPVAPFDYVKGRGYGYLCINPSAIIELKDEPNEPSK